MLRFFLFLLFISFSISANSHSLESDGEDLSLFHHVDVITGALHLSEQDLFVAGAEPIALHRTYSSALPDDPSGAGDWHMLDDLYLWIDDTRPIEQLSVDGQNESFVFSRHDGGSVVLESPSAMLTIDLSAGQAALISASGLCRFYQKTPNSAWYRLTQELMPSGRSWIYSYDASARLSKIAAVNPSHTKIYSFIDILGDGRIVSSDGQSIEYRFSNGSLVSIIANRRPPEDIEYGPQDKISAIQIGDSALKARYLPSGQVERVEEMLGMDGAFVPAAQFSYFPHLTEVRDVDHRLIRYHHDGRRLQKIEYFDENDHLASTTAFFWSGPFLACKALLDSEGQPLFAKTFAYDDGGQLIEERLYGDLTGDSHDALSIDATGRPSGSGFYAKRFQYDAAHHLVEETEDDGPTIRYQYQPGTHLLVQKLTLCVEGVRIREFFHYDDDHFLIEKSIDDGSMPDESHLQGVLERRITRFDIDPDTGLVRAVSELYYDPFEQREKQIRRCEIAYSLQNQIVAEKVFDAHGTERFTIRMRYDDGGRLIGQTHPMGEEDTFLYDAMGRCLEEKHLGSNSITHRYDGAGRRIGSVSERVIETVFDAKGRPLSQTDSTKPRIDQSYDAFGRCTETRCQNGPTIRFGYDASGNLARSIAPMGETTWTEYNAWKKPVRIIHPDGSQWRHRYNRSGTLAETLSPDGTVTRIAYDFFQRMISKKTYSSGQQLLGEESWSYSAFRLISYTDPRGLTTHYRYDGSGRKIAEAADGRIIAYEYDALGFLEKTRDSAGLHIQIHDLNGRVVRQWNEDAGGSMENETSFEYDSEGRQIRATVKTDAGDGVDQFSYDEAGRLIAHTDGEGQTWQFQYSANAKTIIDPEGRITVETSDAFGHLTMREKKSPDYRTLLTEEFFYDLSGNQIRRTANGWEAAWEYDAMGRAVKQIESKQKTTLYAYDAKGRLIEEVRPSQIRLRFSYDGLDRLIEMISSDGSVHTQYEYARGPDPIRIHDWVRRRCIERSYDRFGHIVKEQNGARLYEWSYDDLGRCVLFTLPDQSQIAYDYAGMHIRTIRRINTNGVAYSYSYAAFGRCGHPLVEEMIGRIGAIRSQRDRLGRATNIECPWMSEALDYSPSGYVARVKNSLFGEQSFGYDDLGQLASNKDHFDPLGNPKEWTTDALNRILTGPSGPILYDADGNPIEIISPEGITQYRYDALGQLTQIIHPHVKKTILAYDPLSRLESIQQWVDREGEWTEESTKFFIYDGSEEIGLMNEQGAIVELKVLGRSQKGTLARAIAIEMGAQAYAPVVDAFGNIVALVSLDKELVETYAMSAFGQEKSQVDKPICPWRFASRRSMENLVFFGRRFYDPAHQRWLTCDPAGFQDGANLYAYAQNSPINRLDRFGLYSEYIFRIDLPIASLPPLSSEPTVVQCKGVIGDAKVDWVVSCGFWQKLQFSPEELQAGMINLIDHLADLTPASERAFGLLTYQNGIKTTFTHFNASCQSIADKVPEGTLLLGLHNKTKGFAKDLLRLLDELNSKETPIVIQTRQFMGAMVECLHKINPEFLWGHIIHSEGGAIAKRAIEGMTLEQKGLLREHLFLFSLGSVLPIPENYANHAMNIYSRQDFFWMTSYLFGMGGYGVMQSFLGNHCNVQIIPCSSNWSEKVLYLFDHAFLGGTYGMALDDEIKQWRERYHLYDGQN
ncbi:MAG: hypothetical protein HW387_447 [Parachlamydiales bacterium]|nr:hypothetical protein [Parachlamydiales bacterium]